MQTTSSHNADPLTAQLRFLRHGRSINPMCLYERWGIEAPHLRRIVLMSLTKLSLGELLASRARLRFTWQNGVYHIHIQEMYRGHF